MPNLPAASSPEPQAADTTLSIAPAPYVLVGIDEAGYGPLLGPLCVGLSAFEVAPGPDGKPCLDLWTLLESAVCKQPGRGGKPDARGRVAIADSKELKLASSVKTTHPLVHLERGVLSMLLAMGDPSLDLDGSLDDDWLLQRLRASWPNADWYGGPPKELPLANHEGSVRIAAALLRRSLGLAGVRPIEMACRLIGEAEFNALAQGKAWREGTEATPATGVPMGKAATTSAALEQFLGMAWDRWSHTAGGEGRLGIVCDRQGGRSNYAGLLRRSVPEAEITVLEETEVRSVYVLEVRDRAGEDRRRASVSFLVEGEQLHLPVALASMIAKLTRELAMERFNRYWTLEASKRGVAELKPTAGYATDGARWVGEMRRVLSDKEHESLVRTC